MTHPCFNPPQDEDVPIWKYMHLESLVALLDGRRLFFSRSDLLGDPFEGSVSAATIETRNAIQRELGSYGQGTWDDVFGRMSQFCQHNRAWTFVNCWHMNEHESAAMWSLYGRSVAIRSTYRKLRRQFLSTIVFIGVVNYIDYTRDAIPDGNAFWPYVFKRKSFEHERELRAVMADMGCGLRSWRTGIPQTAVGRELAVEPNDLIEAIVVAPEAPSWKRDVIESVVRKCGFVGAVRQSSLNAVALY